MKKRTQMILVLLCAAVIAFGALLSGEASGLKDFLYGGGNQQTVTITREEYESLQRFEKLGIIMDYIDTYYYQDPDDDLMIEYAIDGMLSALDDPYTFYYNEEAWSDMWADDEGTYAGIGVQLLGNYETNEVTITQVFRDTPAEKAGVHKGDKLVRVDDIEVDATTMEAAVSHMRGESDSAVEVEVIRKGRVALFAANLALAAYQRRLAEQLEIEPGAELKRAVTLAIKRARHVALLPYTVE